MHVHDADTVALLVVSRRCKQSKVETYYECRHRDCGKPGHRDPTEAQEPRRVGVILDIDTAGHPLSIPVSRSANALTSTIHMVPLFYAVIRPFLSRL